MSFTEFNRLTENVAKNLKAGVGHLKEMVSLAPKAAGGFSGIPGSGGGTSGGAVGGGTMGLGLAGFSAPMASPYSGQNFLGPSLSAITTPPPGSDRQGYQSGIGLQGLPTSGQGGMLTSAGGMAFGMGSSRMGGALMGLGFLGAAAGTLLRAYGSGIPDVQEAIGRQTGYYQAAVRGNQSIAAMEVRTRETLGTGITSRGSDALVAAALSNQGMVFSQDPNSTYMQTLRGVGNAAKYLNMDNAAAAMALEGLTGGAGSMNMLRQFGIHTSDPRTGKAYTQGQIFEQIAQRLSAGRPEATAEETLESIRRGNLGETIRNIGLSTDQQELLKQFMVDRASGRYMDLSSDTAMGGIIGDNAANARTNPQLAGMQLNALDTEMMSRVTQDYIKGMQDAVETLGDINQVLSLLLESPLGKGFLQLESQFASLQGSQGGKFIEEFVNAMPGAVSGFLALGLMTGLSGLAGSIATGLGADPSTLSTGSDGFVAPGDLGAGTPTFIKPTNGPVNSNGYFGPRESVGSNDHKGLDFEVPVGSSVVASASGQVTMVSSSGSYGNYVKIAHSGGFETLYAHLSSAVVSAGQSVSSGQQIALSGNTGNTSGPHLHFEIRKDGIPVNPAPYLGIPHRTNSSVSGGGTGGSYILGSMDVGSTSSLSSASSLIGSSSASSSFGSSSPSSLSASAFSSGGSMGTLYLSGAPSAKTGDPYVANDGPVNVHAGEAILTSDQADDWRAMMRGSRRGGGNNVTINVQLANASDGEARRLATMVKQYIEEESLLNNMGRK